MKVNLFLVGAPKSGTTSLAYALSRHPDIESLIPKEPMYFCEKQNWMGPGSDELRIQIERGRTIYEKGFADYCVRYIIDASTDYLSCNEAVHEIYKYNPSAKIIIILRNPYDRMISEYRHCIREEYEDLTFEQSVIMEKNRIKQNYIPLFHHRRRSLYSKNVNEYINKFGLENCLIINYDKFNPYMLNTIQEFLNLDHSNLFIPQLNTADKPRLQFIENILRGKYIPNRLKRSLKSLVGIHNLHEVAKLIRKVNSKPRSRRECAFPKSLISEINADIAKLEDLLGWDLQSWKR